MCITNSASTAPLAPSLAPLRGGYSRMWEASAETALTWPFSELPTPLLGNQSSPSARSPREHTGQRTSARTDGSGS